MNDWTGKRILVLGASGGIGSCCVRQLYDKGATVLAADLSPNEENAAVPFLHCDVSDANSVDDLFSLAKQTLGGLDGFVYACGIGSSAGLFATSLNHFDRVISINLRGAFYASQKAAEQMAAGGSIVLVASQKGLCGSTGSLAYNASKGGMIIMARSMALELGSRGIRVNCVCPGPTETPMFAQDMANQPDEQTARKKVASSNPLNRIADAQQIAPAILYALSDDASFMTGTEIVVDGGNIAGVRNI